MMTLTHRRHAPTLKDGYVILFADSDRNEHYGSHVWTLRTELSAPADDMVAFTADYYNVGEDEARALLNPEDIVDTAAAWDDAQFVSDLWQAMEYGTVAEVAGVRTPDGAAVIDRWSVEMDYKEE
jgi:hypothetical protein